MIQFVPFKLGFGIGFLKFELIPFLFLIFFSFLNRNRILDLIQSLYDKSEEDKLSESHSLVERFKMEFTDLSNTEIEKRLNYNLTLEARKALLEIKSERENLGT